MHTLSNVHIISRKNLFVNLSRGYNYVISTLYNVEIAYEIADIGNFGGEGEDEVLAVYTAWAQLSKLQPHRQQRNKEHQV